MVGEVKQGEWACFACASITFMAKSHFLPKFNFRSFFLYFGFIVLILGVI